MAWNLPESGKIMKLQEVIDSAKQLNGKAVRLIAKLDTHDCVKQRGSLCSVERQHNQRLLLDTRFIEPFHARPGSVFQFIGELDSASSADQPILKVVRCVDGVDVAMYNKALDEQRHYFERRETDNAAWIMQTLMYPQLKHPEKREESRKKWSSHQPERYMGIGTTPFHILDILPQPSKWRTSFANRVFSHKYQ